MVEDLDDVGKLCGEKREGMAEDLEHLEHFEDLEEFGRFWMI